MYCTLKNSNSYSQYTFHQHSQLQLKDVSEHETGFIFIDEKLLIVVLLMYTPVAAKQIDINAISSARYVLNASTEWWI